MMDEDFADQMFPARTWSARKQVENRLTVEVEDNDGVIFNSYDIVFDGDDQAVLEIIPYRS